ncbi:MAG: hypothetical protein C4518_18915 [Desulfobacteraceae bacterium]|nr:MAG: hypothetical protein C4518_18915 [Desulfobacteraceae bacterium]
MGKKDGKETIMTENLYRIVLSGELAAGKLEADVAARMAALFKTTSDKMAMVLKRPGTVVKKDVDLETAKKYARAILSTGALCKIDPPEHSAAASAAPAPKPAEKLVPKSVPQPSAPGTIAKSAEPRVVVIQLSSKPEDRFTPRTVEKISGSADCIDLNISELPEILYDRVLALAAFNETDGGDTRTKMMMFVRSYERPFVCDIDRIVFDGFPIKVFPKSIATFRGLLHLICKQNPSVILEETTLDFLSGSQPQPLDAVKILKLATGIGSLIESGDVDAQT